jgi:hypothetical protein
MTQAPILNGQVIGQAERATRAVLELLLAETDTPFVQWVALNLAAQAEAAQRTTTVDVLVDQLVIGLRIDGFEAGAAIDALVADRLVTIDGAVRLTVDGTATYQQISDGISVITQRLYRDLPQDDLVVARRVLETLTERARAELAQAS